MDTEIAIDTLVGGEIDWIEPGVRGYVNCPGAHLHTHPTGRKDAILYMSGAPNVSCFHSSCDAVRKEFNKDFRAGLTSLGWEPDELTPEVKVKLRARNHFELVAERLRQNKDFIYDEYRWGYDTIMQDVGSQLNLADIADETFPGRKRMQGLFLGQMFHQDEILWIGQPERGQFRKRAAWEAELSHVHGPFICPNPLIHGSKNRTTANLAAKRYFIVECDTADPDPHINKDRCGAVFKYILAVHTEMRLRAVVDSGNKSLHGWFDYPGDAVYDELRMTLPALGADPATMRLSQPVRAPGWQRDTDRYQRLIWLAKGGAK